MFWLCVCLALAAGAGGARGPRRPRARQARPARSDFTNTTFPALNNHHKRGAAAPARRYPWLARLVHSRAEGLPHVCTAACIDERIFVTAARCIFHLKVEFTTVHYQEQILFVRAFVVPSKPTKQMFDDVGFIVVEDEPKPAQWSMIKTLDGVKRTDNEFMWLQALKWNQGPQEHYVVGYAADDNTTKYQAPDTNYTLREIKIVIDLSLCNELTSMDPDEDATDFWVPCYHSCSITADQAGEECKSYHGVEGGAVFDKKNKTLIGVATWGGYDEQGITVLPVGFSVLNSDNFFEDRDCALRIRDSAEQPPGGGLQSLCDR